MNWFRPLVRLGEPIAATSLYIIVQVHLHFQKIPAIETADGSVDPWEWWSLIKSPTENVLLIESAVELIKHQS